LGNEDDRDAVDVRRAVGRLPERPFAYGLESAGATSASIDLYRPGHVRPVTTDAAITASRVVAAA